VPRPRISFVRIVGIAIVAVLAPFAGFGCVKQWLFHRLPEPLFGPSPAPAGLASVSAETCGACHADIYAEWRQTRMAQAWSDPVFRSDFGANHELYACLYCHTPLSEQRPFVVTGLSSLTPVTGAGTPNPSFDPALREEGVTCVSCHLREGALEGPFDGVSAPHPVRANPTFAAADRCESCHQLGEPPLSDLARPIADTHGEWAEWRGATGRTESCVDCHMPAVERPIATGGPVRSGRRHLWRGGWDSATVRSAVDVQLRDDGTVELTNRAGHRFPTADPARALGVTLIRSRGGREVGRETRWIERSVRQPRLVDEGDTTLAPGETRRLTFDVGDATEVRAIVVFDRLKGLPDTRSSAPEDPSLVLFDETVALATRSAPSPGAR
jgi:hypothetical protein